MIKDTDMLEYMTDIPNAEEFDDLPTLDEDDEVTQVLNNNIPEEIRLELTHNQIRAIQERANRDGISYQSALNRVWHELFALYCE